jgi:hypothetical protein
MPTLELPPEDADELQATLEGCFSELRMEIERTENGASRAKLQRLEQLVKKLTDHLKG